MILIKEVGPRDGLQNEKTLVSTEDKITWIQMLEQAGLRYIEVGAFVRPDRVAQLADTRDVIQGLELSDNTQISALVPNEKGFLHARETGIKEVAVFTAASTTFNQKNINMTTEQSLDAIKGVLELAEDSSIKVRAYISTCFDCPFEGEVQSDAVLPIIEKLLELGCYEISIGDTTGKARLEQVDALFAQTFRLGLNGWLAGHFHNTHGHALDHVKQSMLHEVKVFDVSAGGIGGCPFAPGASGNLGTEDLVQFLEDSGESTQIDLKKLYQASAFIEEKIGHDLYSPAYLAQK